MAGETELKQIRQMISNASVQLERAQLQRGLSGTQFGGMRNMSEALGYQEKLTYDDYWRLYDRQDIAARLIDLPVDGVWRYHPTVTEDDDENTETAFEKAWMELDKRLKMNYYFARADRLASIGRYSVLFIGLSDNDDLSQPVNKITPEHVIYLNAFSEKRAEIKTYYHDPSQPNFGRPEFYEINFGEIAAGETKTDLKKKVHESRLIHIADGIIEDEVFGTPVLRRVYDRFMDLLKISGGGAEMFWLGAFQGLHVDFKSEGDIDPDGPIAKATSEAMDDYVHGLKRYLRTQNTDISQLGANIADPKGIFEVIMSLISGARGIPQRILLGSERGQLASEMDETNWLSTLVERQTNYAGPKIIEPFITRLIDKGAFPDVEYEIKWPNLFELDDKEKAEIMGLKSTAIKNYAPFGDTGLVMPIGEFREVVLGVDPEIPEQYKKQQEEMMEDIAEKEAEQQAKFLQDTEDDDEGAESEEGEDN